MCIYKAIVRLHLEYFKLIIQQTYIYMLEIIQIRAINLIPELRMFSYKTAYY